VSNWKSRAISRAAEAVRKAMKARKHSDFLLASALSTLTSALDDGEFRKFCMDHEDGLAVAANTALKYERMVSSLKTLPTEAVWDRVGWEGVVKIVKISTRNERVAVCRAISREEKPIGRQRLADIMEDKAPSYTEVTGRGPDSNRGGISRARAVRERDLFATTLTSLIEEYSSLRSKVPDEVMELLGLAPRVG
jgi:hypothetical protein